jgi:hypothetical protein
LRLQVKLDANHKEIGANLRKLGWPHLDVAHHRGLGFDFLTKHRDGYPILLELKRPGPPSVRKLTESEAFMQTMFPQFYRVAQNWDEVLVAIGLT